MTLREFRELSRELGCWYALALVFVAWSMARMWRWA